MTATALQHRCWPAGLQLGFRRRGADTLLTDRRHVGPLRVQRPFYPEGREVCHVYLLHPPGGLVSGDELQVDVEVHTGAHALLTTPGAGKCYRSDGLDSVRQQQVLKVRDGAVLEWLPQESIVFDGASAELVTRVELEGGGRFMGWEISCLGRPASNEPLRECALRQRFELWRDGQPLWLERSRYGDHSPAFKSAWGLRGHTVTGTLVCSAAHGMAAMLQEELADRHALLGFTQLDDLVVCRYLGDSAWQARELLAMAWKRLRPHALGRAAVAPRIWNT